MTRKRPQNSISLFPFLAVLVCAMGALILLLLVMTRKIRHEQFGGPMETEPIVAAPAILPPDRSDDLAQLESQRNLVQEDLVRLQQQIDALQLEVTEQETDVQKLRQEMADLESSLESATTNPNNSTIDDLKKQIAQLRAQHAALQRRLSEQEKELLAKQQLLVDIKSRIGATQQKLIAMNSEILAIRKQIESAEESAASTGAETVVDFTNTTGTTRVPIMVEVTKDGYTILPAGIQIAAKEMESFPANDTPLMAAILAVHRERSKNSAASTPYVLLLVRPSGSEAFYPAQGILSNERIHFGYELIGDDKKIAAGESSPAESSAAEVAMRESYLRRDKIYANLRLLAQSFGSGGVPGSATGRNGNPDRTSDPNTRGLTFRADGTVGSSSKMTNRSMSSKNFAGGVAPPPGFYENRAAANAMLSRQAGAADRNSADNELSDQFAEHYARSAATANGTPTNDSVQSFETTPKYGANSSSSTSTEQGNTTSFPVVGSPRPTADVTGQTAQTNEIGEAELPRNGLNPGGNGGNPVPESSAAQLAAIGAGERAEALLFNNNGTAPVVGQQATADPLIPSSSGKPGVNGESEPQLTAEEQFAGMMAGANTSESSTQQPLHLQRPSDSTGSSATAMTGDPQPGAPASPLIDLSRVDKDLLDRLPSTKKTSKTYATPVGITVFLDEHHMTVGQHPAIPVDQETLNNALTDLLKNVDTEVSDAKKSPREEVMPIVKFIVSPGGERWRIPLAGSLRHLGIPSATVYELSPHIETVAAPGRATY